MLDKLLEAVEVKTYMLRVHCPDTACKGLLEYDGKQRSEGNLHGGAPEYRHRCTICTAGYWVKDIYPKVHYEIVEPEPKEPEYVKARNSVAHHKGPRNKEEKSE